MPKLIHLDSLSQYILGLRGAPIHAFRTSTKCFHAKYPLWMTTENCIQRRYWRPQDETIWSGDFDDHMKNGCLCLGKSVWKFYECSDRKPVIADFTAGEDSRLILAQCHALGIPFRAHVTGLADDIDVIVAKEAASKLDLS